MDSGGRHAAHGAAHNLHPYPTATLANRPSTVESRPKPGATPNGYLQGLYRRGGHGTRNQAGT